jgi:peptide/nickel transport system substrate-binding protein
VQPYIRQAPQLLIDQPELIKTAGGGYGVPDYGPVPAFPRSQFLSEKETVNPYPFDPTKAELLLTMHGWKINPEGADICIRAGTVPDDCGKGIRGQANLRFTDLYSNSSMWPIQLVVAESSAWAKAGIQAEPEGESFFSLVGALSGPCETLGPDRCSSEMGNWGGGWLFEPDYMPTGEHLFSEGADANSGSYHNAAAERLITETHTSNKLGDLHAYENFLAESLPVLWQPNNQLSPYEISKDLGGVSPINTLGSLTPEYWYWKTASRS